MSLLAAIAGSRHRGPAAAFIVTDGYTDLDFATYAGAWYESGIETTSNSHAIYTNDAHYWYFDGADGHFRAVLADAQAELAADYIATTVDLTITGADLHDLGAVQVGTSAPV